MKKLLAVLMVLALMAAGTGIAEGGRTKIDPEMEAQLQKVFAEHRRKNAEEAAVINHESPEERIRYLQELLCGLGLLETITGQYDAATLSAVAQFQERMNKEQNAALPITGIADAQTITLLEKQPLNPDMEVEIGDAELEKILREKTGKITGAITVSDLLEIEELELWNAPISDISALQHLPNLQKLSIADMKVSDISVLQHLPNLQWLLIGGMNVRDISTLQTLTNLQSLYILDTPVSDIGALKNLASLQMLYLDNTQVQDIDVLQSLTDLRELYIADTPIRDISALQNMANLEYLMMENTQVKDIRIFEEWSRPLAVCLLESDNYELGNIKQNKNIDLIIVQYPMEFNY